MNIEHIRGTQCINGYLGDKQTWRAVASLVRSVRLKFSWRLLTCGVGSESQMVDILRWIDKLERAGSEEFQMAIALFSAFIMGRGLQVSFTNPPDPDASQLI